MERLKHQRTLLILRFARWFICEILMFEYSHSLKYELQRLGPAATVARKAR